MYKYTCFIILCTLLVCCDSNLFTGRISTRPSAGKRTITAMMKPYGISSLRNPMCSSTMMESIATRMMALHLESEELSNKLRFCRIIAD